MGDIRIISEGKTKAECCSYFQDRFKERARWNRRILDDYDMYDKNMLDVCSGFGHDSVFFAKMGRMNVDCIEFDKKAVQVHKSMIRNRGIKNRVFCMDVFDFDVDKKYDVVYTSSPSNWMMSNPKRGIPSVWLDFLSRYSREFLVFRLYGGSFRREVCNSGWFIKKLSMCLKKINFEMLLYVNETHNNYIVVSKSGAQRK